MHVHHASEHIIPNFSFSNLFSQNPLEFSKSWCFRHAGGEIVNDNDEEIVQGSHVVKLDLALRT